MKELDLLTRAAVDLADRIRVRITTRQEDAAGKGGFGPFQNSGGMWAGLGVRTSNNERVNINFTGDSPKSSTRERFIQNEENQERRRKKQKMEKEKIVKVYKNQRVPNRMKAASAIGLIGDAENYARPAFRRELMEPSEAEVQEVLTIASTLMERAIIFDPLEYESYTASNVSGSGKKKASLLNKITRITEKYPNLSK